MREDYTYATFIANAIRRADRETSRRRVKKSKEGRGISVGRITRTRGELNRKRTTGRYGQKNYSSPRGARGKTRSWNCKEGREEGRWAGARIYSGTRDRSFMQGTIVNQSASTADHGVEWLSPRDRKSESDRGREEEEGKGVKNILFAVVLTRRPARRSVSEYRASRKSSPDVFVAQLERKNSLSESRVLFSEFFLYAWKGTQEKKRIRITHE